MTDRKKQAHRINKAVEGQSIKRIVFLLVLVWTCPAFGATKYVATDGSDATGDGSIGNPWLTIQYAFSQINSGDTIKVGAGTYYESVITVDRTITATIESQSGSNDVWIKSTNTNRIVYVTAAGTFVFNNISFMPIGASCSYLIDGGAVSNYDLTFNDCVMDMNGLAGKIFYTTTGTGENIRFNGCTITAENASGSLFYIDSVNVFEANNCNITTGGNTNAKVFRWVNNDCNTIEIKDCNINAGGFLTVIDIAYAGTDDSLEHLIITGNTATGFGCFIKIYDADVRFAKICNNTLTSTVDGQIILDIGVITSSWTNIFSGFVIKNNTITRNATNGDCIWLGPNTYGAEVAYNTIISSATTDNPHGIQVRGKYHNIHHNFCKAPRSLYLHASGVDVCYNKVQYNTFYSTYSYCFSWETDGTYFVSKNIFTNNIFDASGSPAEDPYAMRDGYYAPHGPYDNYIDYNCYKAGSAGAVNLDSTIYNTLSELQAKWAEWSDVWPENDAHSIIADPQFLDPANGDFRLKPDSPCLNAGEPTVGNGYTDIGAWQTIGRRELLLPNCTQSLEIDFNGDCKVDFYDFALFSLSWLDCNLDPPELCWE